jgi:hypothetical protein
LSEITAAIHLWANSEETQAKIAESGEKLGMYVANGIANAFTDGTATHEAMEGVYKGLKNLDKEAKTEFSNIAGVWVENFISGFYKRITGKEMSERWGRIIADGMKQAMMSAFSYMDISSWWNMALNAVMGWVKLIPEFINQTLNKINTGYFQQYNNPGTAAYYSYQGATGGGYLPPSYGTAAWYSLNGVFANGGNFTVPQGYPNDSYRIGLTSGETVSVTPAGKSSAQTVIVNYQPTFSLADRAEFTNKLMPLLRDALRAV